MSQPLPHCEWHMARPVAAYLLAGGQSEGDILTNYPGLTHEDILACLAYANHLADEYRAFPLPV